MNELLGPSELLDECCHFITVLLLQVRNKIGPVLVCLRRACAICNEPLNELSVAKLCSLKEGWSAELVLSVEASPALIQPSYCRKAVLYGKKVKNRFADAIAIMKQSGLNFEQFFRMAHVALIKGVSQLIPAFE